MAEKAKKKSKKAAKKKAATKTARKVKPKAVSKKKAKKVTAKKSAKKKVVKKKSTKATKKVDMEKIEMESPPLEEKFFEDSSASMDESSPLPLASDAVRDPSQVTINLSQTLIKKLKSQASEEGISLEEFISELLSESVVLRAWEIVERKNQMRSMPSQNMGNRSGNVGNGNGNSNNSRGNNRKNRGQMSHGRYQSIMDDKASFLEYVRNQERSRR